MRCVSICSIVALLIGCIGCGGSNPVTKGTPPSPPNAPGGVMPGIPGAPGGLTPGSPSIPGSPPSASTAPIEITAEALTRELSTLGYEKGNDKYRGKIFRITGTLTSATATYVSMNGFVDEQGANSSLGMEMINPADAEQLSGGVTAVIEGEFYTVSLSGASFKGCRLKEKIVGKPKIVPDGEVIAVTATELVNAQNTTKQQDYSGKTLRVKGKVKRTYNLNVYLIADDGINEVEMALIDDNEVRSVKPGDEVVIQGQFSKIVAYKYQFVGCHLIE